MLTLKALTTLNLILRDLYDTNLIKNNEFETAISNTCLISCIYTLCVFMVSNRCEGMEFASQLVYVEKCHIKHLLLGIYQSINKKLYSAPSRSIPRIAPNPGQAKKNSLEKVVELRTGAVFDVP